MRVERLPFTVYDIVGYLIPGVASTFVFLLIYFTHIPEAYDAVQHWLHSNFSEVNDSWYFEITAFIVFLFFSYVFGFVISIVSANSVERVLNKIFGYPSQYLQGNYDQKSWFEAMELCNIAKTFSLWVFEPPNFNKEEIWKLWGLLFVYFLVLPVTLIFIFLSATGLFKAINKPLGEEIFCKLEKNFNSLEGNFDKHKPHTWFRFISFYVMNNSETGLHRMYNYVTLYGFLRHVTFIFSTFLSLYTVHAFFDYATFSWWFWAGLLFSTVLLYIAFAKFYRRYSEEAIMAFVTYQFDNTLNNARSTTKAKTSKKRKQNKP